MNHIYKVIYSKVKEAYVVVSEIARNHGKKKSERMAQLQSIRARFLTAFAVFSLITQGTLPLASAEDVTQIKPIDGIALEKANNGQYSIWVQKLLNENLGLNQFDTFSLAQGDTARLYFSRQNDETNSVNTLVNLVNAHISINGTLNAIRAGKIGGDVFFLSPNGMSVGATGVINAGALTVLTPTEAAMKALVEGDDAADLEAIKKLVQDPTSIALNASGTIRVAGHINTYGNVNLYAGQSIELAEGSEVKNGLTDFSQLVNTTETDIQKSLDADAADNWVATQNKDGDIVLSVKNSKTGSAKANDISANAKITLAGALQAKGKLDATATSEATLEMTENKKAKKEDMKELNLKNFLDKMDLTLRAVSGKAVSKAEIEVTKEADIKAHEVNLNANSTLKATIGADTTKIENTGKYAGLDPAVSVVVAKTENDAIVTVKGKIEATGTLDENQNSDGTGQINIEANANSDVKVSAVEASEKAKAKDGKTSTESLTHTAVAVSNIHNQATVNVESQEADTRDILTADKVSIKALTTESLDTSAKVAASDTSALATAVNVTFSDSKAEVKIKDSHIQSNAGDTVILAKNTVENNTITADNGIAPPVSDAEETDTKDEKKETSDTAKNVLTSVKSEKKTDTKKEEKDNTHAVLKIAGKVSDKIGSTLGNKTGLANKLSDMLDLGASVAVTSQTNDASVNLVNTEIDAIKSEAEGAQAGTGSNTQAAAVSKVLDTEIAELLDDNKTAEDEVSEEDAGSEGRAYIKASITIDANSQEISGNLNTQQGESRGEKVNLNADAAVLVSSMENNAEVTTKDNTQIKADKVDIQSQAEMEDNLHRMIDELVENGKALKKKSPENWKKFKEKFSNVFEAFKKFELLKNDSGGNVLDSFSAISTNVKSLYEDVKKRSAEVGGVAVEEGLLLYNVYNSLEQFRDIENYKNYYVHTESLTQTGETGEAAKGNFGLVGAVNVSNVSQKAQTIIGTDTKITAPDTSIASQAKTRLISITGDSDIRAESDGTSIGIGGAVGITDVSSAAVTAVGENVEISNGMDDQNAPVNADTISITSDNQIGQQDIVMSSGKTGTAGVSGMVNLMTGYSDSITTVDNSIVLRGVTTQIKASNDNVSTAITGGLSSGTQNTAASIGAGTAIVNYDVNTMAVIADNDPGQELSAEQKTTTAEDKANKKRTKAIERAHKILGAKKAYLSASENEEQTSQIVANDLEVSAESKGMLNAIAVEAVANTTASKPKTEDSDEKEKSAKETLDDISAPAKEDGTKDAGNLADTVKEETDEKLDAVDKEANDENSDLNKAANAGTDATKEEPETDEKKAEEGKSDKKTTKNSLKHRDSKPTKTSVNIAGAGSVAITTLNGDTTALLDNVKVNSISRTESIKAEDGSDTGKTETVLGRVSVNASDKTFNGDWAGAAAINWFKANGKAAAEDTSSSRSTVSIGGAAAANMDTRGVASIISNSTIEKAETIENTATDKTTDVAAGLGLSVAKNGSEKGVNVAVGAAVSYQKSERDNYALMVKDTVDNDVKHKTKVANKAENNELQITGGLSTAVASGGSGGASIGATVAINDSHNDTQSVISGGKYTQVDDLEIEAWNSSKTITAAAAIGVASASSTSTGALSGAVVYNKVNNETRAAAENTADIAADRVVITANDKATDNIHKVYVENRGISGSGELGTERVKTEALDADKIEPQKPADPDDKEAKERAEQEAEQARKADADSKKKMSEDAQTVLAKKDSKGSTVVNAALSIARGGSAEVAAAVNIGDITNKMTAETDNVTITAESVAVRAENKALLVSASAGMGRADKFGGAGSVGWNTIKNDAIAKVKDSTISKVADNDDDTDNIVETLSLMAKNEAQIVNVAGQVTLADISGGLALAYNRMNDSTTGAYLEGGDITANTISVSAENKENISAYAVGLMAASKGAINGSIAINRGANHTEAVVGKTATTEANDKTTLQEVKKLSVTTEDNSVSNTLAGGLTKGTSAAVGGAVAYGDIGGSGTDSKNAKQQNRAAIENAEITTEDDTTKDNTAAVITAVAKDNGTINSTAVGASASGKVAIQGAAAVANINKNVAAELKNTKINQGDSAPIGKGILGVEAENTAKIASKSLVLAGAGKVAAGVGLAVNRITQDTQANLVGGEQNLQSANIKATGNTAIEAIGVGGAGAGTVAVAGSVAINNSENNVKAHVEKAEDLKAEGSIGVIAQSDDTINNYAGAISGAGTAAIGATVAVNTLTGKTVADVVDSTIEAKGNSEKKIAVNSDLVDGAIINDILKKDMLTGKELQSKRKASAGQTGLVIDSSATHAIASMMATAGGAGTAAINGTVAVSRVAGETKAALTNTDVNKNLTDMTNADVAVKASDYTNTSGVNIVLAGAGTVAVGGASNNMIIDRTIEAAATGKGKTETAIKAKDFSVQALSKQGLSSAVLSAQVSGNVTAGATVLVDDLKSTTKAKVDNITISYKDTATVNAEHTDNSYLAAAAIAGAAEGASIAAAVNVNKQESTVTAEVTNSKITSENTSSTAEVQADNSTYTKALSAEAAIGGLAVAAGANVTVNSFEQQVKTNISGSSLQAGQLDISADNKVTTDTTSGSLGLSAVSVGAGVAINTFNDETTAEVKDSTLKATSETDDVNLQITSIANRDISQKVGSLNGGIATVDADVMLTNLNEKIDTKDDKIKSARSLVDTINSSKTMSGKVSGLSETERSEIADRAESAKKIGDGTSKAQEGVHVRISDNSKLESTGMAFIMSDENNAIRMTNAALQIAGVNVNAGVNILNAKHKNDVKVEASEISADDVILFAYQADGSEDGKSKGTEVNIVQGKVAGIDVGAAYSRINNSGETDISAKDSTITAKNGLLGVLAMDSSSTTVKNTGITVSGVTAGAIVAKVENTSNVGVTLAGTSLTAKTSNEVGSLYINANKGNKTTAEAVGGSVALATGKGIQAEATDSGTAYIRLAEDSGSNSASNSLTADYIALKAENTPEVLADAAGVAAGIAAVQVTEATAALNGGAELTAKEGNRLSAKNVVLQANVGANEREASKAKVTAKYTATSVSGLGVGVGGSHANSNTKVTVNIGELNYDGTKNLTIKGENAVERLAKGKSLDIGLVAASGTVVTTTSGEDDIDVKAQGNAGKNSLEALKVSAVGNTKATADATGSGGGLTDLSPQAAKAINTFKNSDAKATLTGDWQAKSVDLDANQNIHSIIKTKTTKASLAGYNGSYGKTEIIDEAAKENKNPGTVATLGQGSITAETIDVDAKNNIVTNEAVDGISTTILGVTGSSLQAKEEIKKTAKIVIEEGSNVNTTKAQSYEAGTEGDFSNASTLNGNGIGIDSTNIANATQEITVNNTIESSGNLINQGKYDDGGITLAAYDDLQQNVKASADGAYAVAGTVSAKIDNTVNRNNTVDIKKGTVVSDRDLNIYAGATEEKNAAGINMELNAAAYNKALIPAGFTPEIDVKVNEKSQVKVENGATGEATRHINILSNGGRTDIAKSLISYTWVQGGQSDDGGYVTSTPGKVTPGITKNNQVTVDGSLIAGTKNKLNITIEDGAVPGVSDAVVTIPKVYQSGVKQGAMNYANALAKRWDKLKTLMQEYSGKDNTSQEALTAYLGYKTELESIEARMEKLGFLEVEKDSIGKVIAKYPRTSEVTARYVELPSLVASGGDINITTDTLSSTNGTLIANGNPEITIDNNSSYILKLNDVVIPEQGGHIRFNDAEISNGKAGKKEIDAKNIVKNVANFKQLESVKDADRNPRITVNNNYVGGTRSIKLTEKDVEQLNKELNEADEARTAWYDAAKKELDDKKTKATITDTDYQTALDSLNTENDKRQEELKQAKASFAVDKTIAYTPIFNMELNGEIDNRAGDVTLQATQGDIVISSGTSTQKTGVNAAGTVKINAPNGSIQQSFTTGIVNINGNPETKYGKASSALESTLIKNTSKDSHESENHPLSDLASEEYAESITSVRSIFEQIRTSKSLVFFPKFAETMEKVGTNKMLTKLKDQSLRTDIRYQYAKAILEENEKNNNLIGSTDELIRLAKSIESAYQGVVTETSNNSGYIAGGNVYLAATDINVNGLIQSGYDTYQANITQEEVNAAKNGLTEAVNVDGRTMYRVNINGGNSIWDENAKQYAYEVQVYYDKLTDKLVVADIDTQGGNIHLTGNISSTGNGKISALDGGADIKIVNTSDMDLQIGNIYNNDIHGQVVITDTNKNVQTTYTKDKTTVIDKYTEYLKTNANGLKTEKEKSSVYDPNNNLRYNWTHGTQTVTRSDYVKTSESTWWGLHDEPTTTDLANFEKYIKPETSEKNPKQSALSSGVFIKEDSKLTGDYAIDYTNVVLSNTRTNAYTKVSKSGLFGWRKTYRTYWTTTTGSKQTYVHSIKANNPISISFMGKADGAIDITNTNSGKGGSIELLGNIRNHTAASSFTATADEAITQDNNAVIVGNDVTLNAKSGIDNIVIQSMGTKDSDVVKLNANTERGDVEVTVNAGAGLAGNVELTALKSDNEGKVSLQAAGSITQTGTAQTVKGTRIDLASRNGTVGTLNEDGTGQALVIHAGQDAYGSDTLSASVNVQAKGSINLEQRAEKADKSDGNMRAGTIKSQEGNVKLTAHDGYIIDATPESANDNDLAVSKRVEGWIRDGRIKVAEDNEVYAEMKAQATERVEEKIKDDYANYLNLKEYYADTKNIPKDKDGNIEDTDMSYKSYTDYEKRFKDYATADAYIAAVKGSDGMGTAGSYYQTLMTQELGDDSKKWTREQLLFAISDSISNKTEGSTDKSAKKANIFAKNIILDAQGVGLNNAKSMEISVADLTDLTKEENLNKLKILAKADYAEIERVVDKDGNTISYIVTGKTPLGVHATGTVEVTSTDGKNVYLAARSDDKDTGSRLSIKEIRADGASGGERGNVRIYGKAGVVAANEDSVAADVVAKDLLIEGGEQAAGGPSTNIGTSERNIQVDLTGTLTTRTSADSYIKNVGVNDLTMGGSYAGESMYINANGKAIQMNEDAAAYLNAGTAIYMNNAKAVGTADNAVRILANGSGISINGESGGAAENIYLAGKLGTNEKGTLRIDTLKAENTISVTSDDDLQLGSTAEDTQEASMSDIEAKTVKLAANNDLRLEAGVLKATNAELTAQNGKLVQGTAHQVQIADTVKLTANKGIAFVSNSAADKGKTVNTFHKAVVSNASDTADVAIAGDTVNADNTMTVAFAKDSKAKNLTITHVAGTADKRTVKLNVTTADGTGTKAAENIQIRNAEGSIETSAALKAGGNISILAKDTLTATAAVTAESTLKMEADGTITADKSLEGKKGVSLNSTKGDIETKSIVNSSDGTVSMNSTTGNITTDAVSAGADASLTAGKNLTTNGDISAKADAELTAGGNIVTNNTVNAGLDATLVAGNSLTANGAITAGDDVSLIAANNVTTKGAVKGATVTAGSTTADAVIGGAVTADKAATLTAAKDLAVNGEVKAADAKLTAEQGTLTTTADVTATHKADLKAKGAVTTGATVSAKNADIQSTDSTASVSKLTADESASVKAKSDVALHGEVQAKDVSVTSQAGKLDAEEAIKATNTAKLEANGTITAAKSIEGKHGVSLNSTKGDIETKSLVNSSDGTVSLTSTAGTITTESVSAGKDAVLKAGKDLTTRGTVDAKASAVLKAGENVQTNRVNAGADASLTAGKDITTNGVISAKADAELIAGSNIVTNSTVNAGLDATLVAGNSLTTNGAITAGDDVSLTAKNNVTTKAAVNGAKVTAESTAADVVIGGAVTADKAATLTAAKDLAVNGEVKAVDAKLSAEQGTLTTTADVTATHKADLKAKGAVTTGATVSAKNADIQSTDSTASVSKLTADESASVKAKSDVALHGEVQAKDVSVTSQAGKLDAEEAIKATNTAKLEANGTITTAKSIEGKNGVNLTSTKGDIETKNLVKSSDGTVGMNSTTGTITTESVSAGKDAVLKAGKDLTTSGTVDAKASAVLKAGENVQTNRVNAGADASLTAGKEIMTNGAISAKADAELTAGANIVTNNTVNAGLDATLTAGDSLTANGAITAGDDVSLTAKNNVTTKAAVNGANATIQSKSGNVAISSPVTADKAAMLTAAKDLAVNGEVKAADAKLTADQGTLTANANVTATNTADLKASGTVMTTKTIEGGNGVSLSSTQGDIDTESLVSSTSGSVSMNSTSGSITAEEVSAGKDAVLAAGKDITANGVISTQASTMLTAGGNIVTNDGVTAGTEAVLKAGQDITANGVILSQTDAMLAAGGNVVTNASVQAGKTASLTADKNITTHADVGAQADVMLTAGEDVVTNDSISAGSNATLTAGDSLTTAGTITADNAVILNATNNVTTKAAVDAASVIAESKAGDVTVGGTIVAMNLASLSAKKDVVNQAAIAAGTVNMQSQQGTVKVDAAVQADGDATLTAEAGSVMVIDSVGAKEVIMQASGGNVEVKGSVTADNNAVLKATDGTVHIADGSTLSVQNDLLLMTNRGDIQVDSNQLHVGADLAAATMETGAIEFAKDIEAGNNLIANTQRGDIHFGGQVTAKSGSVSAQTEAAGDIVFDDSVHAAKDVVASTGVLKQQDTYEYDVSTSNEEGKIVLNGSVNAGGSIALFTTDDGKTATDSQITIRDDLTAGELVYAEAKSGSIVFESAAEGREAKEIQVKSDLDNGIVYLMTDQQGDIRDSYESANGTSVNIEAGISLVLADGEEKDDGKASGLVHLNRVYGSSIAAVESNDQTIKMNEINGELVAIFTDTPGQKVDITHIVAGQTIEMDSDIIDINDIKQRPDSDNILDVNLRNPENEYAPIESLDIGEIGSNKFNRGIAFPALTVKNGKLGIKQGKLYFDKLYVTGNLRVNAGDNVTDIYGSAPVYHSDATSSYWIDTSINNPELNQEAWDDSTNLSQWMYLRFTGADRVQDSNGNLLHLDKGYRVNNQRYALVDWMRRVEDPSFHRYREGDALSEIAHYDRFDLVESSAIAKGENVRPISEDEIVLAEEDGTSNE